ncbi:MAG: alpha/beta hydrolase [Novosphingobium sp.]|nr:alpha/beta hydrolase [Novosphingobium sp.]
MKILGPTSNSFVSQRLKLHYVDWGNRDAPPLILQHGGRDHCRSWDWVAEELRHDWHVICPDLRGHGDSSWSADGEYSLNAYVYDFTQLVHTLGYDQVTIIAHSLGGTVTSRFAGLYPEKVAKYVNIEGLGLTARDLAERQRLSFQDQFREWIDKKRNAAGRAPRRYPSLEAAYRRMIEENDYLTEEQARHLTIHGASRNEDGTFSWKFDPYLNVWPFHDLTPEQIHSLWEAITCPTLLLWGKDSFFSSPANDGRLDHFQNARLVEFENAGHWLHHDQFDRFMAEIRAFLY